VVVGQQHPDKPARVRVRVLVLSQFPPMRSVGASGKALYRLSFFGPRMFRLFFKVVGHIPTVRPASSCAIHSNAWKGFSPRPIFRHLHSSTLAIGLNSKPHRFRFLGCPGDFLRVGRLHRPAKSPRSLHKPKSPPLMRTRRRTRHCAKRTTNRPGKSGSRSLGAAPFRAPLRALRRQDRKSGACRRLEIASV
jgi:hypothetical protein